MIACRIVLYILGKNAQRKTYWKYNGFEIHVQIILIFWKKLLKNNENIMIIGDETKKATFLKSFLKPTQKLPKI